MNLSPNSRENTRSALQIRRSNSGFYVSQCSVAQASRTRPPTSRYIRRSDEGGRGERRYERRLSSPTQSRQHQTTRLHALKQSRQRRNRPSLYDTAPKGAGHPRGNSTPGSRADARARTPTEPLDSPELPTGHCVPPSVPRRRPASPSDDDRSLKGRVSIPGSFDGGPELGPPAAPSTSRETSLSSPTSLRPAEALLCRPLTLPLRFSMMDVGDALRRCRVPLYF